MKNKYISCHGANNLLSRINELTFDSLNLDIYIVVYHEVCLVLVNSSEMFCMKVLSQLFSIKRRSGTVHVSILELSKQTLKYSYDYGYFY